METNVSEDTGGRNMDRSDQQPQCEQSEEVLLDVDSVSVEYETQDRSIKALRDVSLEVGVGETLGIAGESGSGKSTLALAILRYLGDNGRIAGGDIRFKDRSLLDLSADQLRSIRGNHIAHVPQNPEKSLNPSMVVGKQIAESIRLHRDKSRAEAKQDAIEMLEQVNISDPEYNYDRYPHELSGGMQQRVLLAMALSCNPELLIMDEPTTGLDVTTQVKVLDLVNDLKQKFDTSIVLITHDLGVLAETVDRVAILYAGEIMEKGGVEAVFNGSANPYTQGLLSSTPEIGSQTGLSPIPGQIPDLDRIPDGCIFADRCEFAEDACQSAPIEVESVPGTSDHVTRCRRWETALDDPITPEQPADRTNRSLQRAYESGEKIVEVENVVRTFGEQTFLDSVLGGDPPVQAVNGVSLEVYESETVGLVGESGCGKSTLGEICTRLLDVDSGKLYFRGEDVTNAGRDALREFRKETSIVFQDPDSSLNPQKTVYEILARPLRLFTDMDEQERRDRVAELLSQVSLGPEYANKHPHELSGGEQQRVAIARAFASNPSFVVLDEPVSALDASVQANILNLLQSLKEEYGTSYLLISHDLSVVNHVCDRVAVMYLGEIIEMGTQAEVFEPPYHPYTQALLSSKPSTDPSDSSEPIYLEGDVPSARDPPSGCSFHTRCPKKIGEVCETDTPAQERVGTADDQLSHTIACHLDEDEMVSPPGDRPEE